MHKGDYCDALDKRKARVTLLVHETLGGMSPTAARHLRRLARAAADDGTDATDYSRSYTARSFVPFYAQKISSACVMNAGRRASSRASREPRVTAFAAPAPARPKLMEVCLGRPRPEGPR